MSGLTTKAMHMNITLVSSEQTRIHYSPWAVCQTITLSDLTVWSKVTTGNGTYDLDEFDVDFGDAGDDIHSMLEAWHWHRRTVSEPSGEVVDELFQEQGCFNIPAVNDNYLPGTNIYKHSSTTELV